MTSLTPIFLIEVIIDQPLWLKVIVYNNKLSAKLNNVFVAEWYIIIYYINLRIISELFISQVDLLLGKFVIKNWIATKLPYNNDKVHIFWEGHKIMQNLHLTFDCVYTANVYRQTTDKLMFKSVISTVRWIRK